MNKNEHKPQCWANSLGDCCNTSSREHLVSKSLFHEDKIEVTGFPWCKKGKIIGIESLTSKILCKSHNEKLSNIDIGGSDIFKKLTEAAEFENQRLKKNDKPSFIRTYNINGKNLERWFLKTLINLTVNSKHPLGRGNNSIENPRNDLIDILYNQKDFEGKAGLYFIVKNGMNINWLDREYLAFSPLIKDDTHIEGGIFRFKGFSFLLFLEPVGLPTEPLHGIDIFGQDLGDCQLNYRNHKIIVKSGNYISQEINFIW